jgi:hypothetical protein
MTAVVEVAARQCTTRRAGLAREIKHIIIPSYRNVTERDADTHTRRQQT